MNDAKPIIDQLILFGYIKGRPMIAITNLTDINTFYSQVYGYPIGVYIGKVTKNSVAEKSGLKAGDVITKLAGKKVETQADLSSIIKTYKAGDIVDITVVRSKKEVNLKLTFDEDK